MNAISPIETALVQNDLAKLTPEQRLSYYNQVCLSMGLNPLTQPFSYITLNGKLALYAKRDATDQLRKIHSVSIEITSRQKIEDIYIVTAKAIDASGRTDESTGAVNIKGLGGEALANAFLKAETKAKRRVTLSICGLGMLDETEVESISKEQRQTPPQLGTTTVNKSIGMPDSSPAEEPKPKQEAPKENPFKITTKQVEGLKASILNNHLKDDLCKIELRRLYKLEKYEDLTEKQYKAFCEHLSGIAKLNNAVDDIPY